MDDRPTRTATVNVLGLRYEFALGNLGSHVSLRFVLHCLRWNHIFASKCALLFFHMKTSLNGKRNSMRHSQHVYCQRTSHTHTHTHRLCVTHMRRTSIWEDPCQIMRESHLLSLIWNLCWLVGWPIFKSLIARSLYKSFGVKSSRIKFEIIVWM
jgi:hypothetical protein